MLVLVRKDKQRVFVTIGDVTFVIKVCNIERERVTLAFDAPPEVVILREELVEREKGVSA